MRPKSPVALVLCLLITIASVGLLIARFCGWIQIHWLGVAVAVCAGIATAYMVVKEYFRKPFVREFNHSDWTVEDRNSRKGVFIRISKSVHNAGNNPQYTFLDKGILYGKDFEVVDDDGDLTIYRPENSFLPQYKTFVIRIV